LNLIIIPVFNEERHIRNLITRIRSLNLEYEILIVDDGSTDSTSQIAQTADVDHYIRHQKNQGCGASLTTGFDFAVRGQYDIAVTIDGDEQHDPNEIPTFLKEIDGTDIVSGNRFSPESRVIGLAPSEKIEANRIFTEFVNKVTGYSLHDAFCGFKSYKVNSLANIKLTLRSYAWPIELFVQAQRFRLVVKEIPISRIYLDTSRKLDYYAKFCLDEMTHYLKSNFDLKAYQDIMLFWKKYIPNLDF